MGTGPCVQSLQPAIPNSQTFEPRTCENVTHIIMQSLLAVYWNAVQAFQEELKPECKEELTPECIYCMYQAVQVRSYQEVECL